MIAQLLLGHFIADYPAQTDWIFARKLAGWPGLFMHGGVVLVAQAAAVFPHTFRLAPLVIGMTVVHVLQDFAKVRYGHLLLGKYPIVAYVVDQLLHVVLIVLVSPRMIDMVGQPTVAVRWTAAVAACLVVMTWTYYITWRVAVGYAETYPITWRWTGKLERALALLAGLVGLFWLAPLAVTPRLLSVRSRGVSLTGERYLLLDMVLGIALSAAAGWGLLHFVPF